MELEYDPVLNLRHYPMPMARFGTSPFGENLYRIVFTASRRHLVGRQWSDGHIGYHWRPKYRAVKAAWILERWSPEKLSKREWDRTMVDPFSGLLLFGPYPARGDYELAWEFDHGVEADSLDNLIAAVERGRSRSFEDLRTFHKAEYETEERDFKREAEAEVRDAVTAFGNAPVSSSRLMRGSKTAPEMRFSARDLGMRGVRGPAQRKLRGMEMKSAMFAGRQAPVNERGILKGA
jgi:hypothetical protein